MESDLLLAIEFLSESNASTILHILVSTLNASVICVVNNVYNSEI